LLCRFGIVRIPSRSFVFLPVADRYWRRSPPFRNAQKFLLRRTLSNAVTRPERAQASTTSPSITAWPGTATYHLLPAISASQPPPAACGVLETHHGADHSSSADTVRSVRNPPFAPYPMLLRVSTHLAHPNLLLVKLSRARRSRIVHRLRPTHTSYHGRLADLDAVCSGRKRGVCLPLLAAFGNKCLRRDTGMEEQLRCGLSVRHIV